MPSKYLAQICTVILRFPSRPFGLYFFRSANQDVVVESFRRINAKVSEGFETALQACAVPSLNDFNGTRSGWAPSRT